MSKKISSNGTGNRISERKLRELNKALVKGMSGRKAAKECSCNFKTACKIKSKLEGKALAVLDSLLAELKLPLKSSADLLYLISVLKLDGKELDTLIVKLVERKAKKTRRKRIEIVAHEMKHDLRLDMKKARHTQ